MQEEKQTYKIDEAARYLSVSTLTLRRWIYAGVSPRFIQLNRKYIFRKEALDAWLKKNERSK